MRTLNNESHATLPAALQLTRKAYARYFASTSLRERALFAGTFVPYWLGKFVGFSRSRTPHWVEVQEHLAHGCLCPAQVLDLDRGLIATFTNLNARDERSFPALKVTSAPLHLLPPALRHNGARLACASIYQANAESWEAGYWVDFSPLPIDCLVEDQAACEAARQRLSPLSWQALDIALGQLDKSFPVGLHRVAVPHEIVWNAF